MTLPSHIAQFAAGGLFAAAALLIILVIAWQTLSPHEDLRNFAGRRLARFEAYLFKLWRFWGPRLADKHFIGSVSALGTALISAHFAPDDAQLILYGLAVFGALMTPLWENHPFSDLEGERPAPTVEISGPVQIRSR